MTLSSISSNSIEAKHSMQVLSNKSARMDRHHFAAVHMIRMWWATNPMAAAYSLLCNSSKLLQEEQGQWHLSPHPPSIIRTTAIYFYQSKSPLYNYPSKIVTISKWLIPKGECLLHFITIWSHSYSKTSCLGQWIKAMKLIRIGCYWTSSRR